MKCMEAMKYVQVLIVKAHKVRKDQKPENQDNILTLQQNPKLTILMR
jgi:hypothetical protein